MKIIWWPFIPAAALALVWVYLHFAAPVTIELPGIGSASISRRN